MQALKKNYKKTFQKFRDRFKPKSETALKKAYLHNGNLRPEPSDPEGMKHPEKPYIKKTNSRGEAVWAYNHLLSSMEEKKFLSSFNNLYASKKLTPAGKQSLIHLAKQVADDPDRHSVASSPFHGQQELRLRHLTAAMSGKPGYSIEESPGGTLHIHAERHSRNPDQRNQAHTWSFHPDFGLKFLGSHPISSESPLGGTDGQKNTGKFITRSKSPEMGGSFPGGKREAPDSRELAAPVRRVAKSNGKDGSKAWHNSQEYGPLIIPNSKSSGWAQNGSGQFLLEARKMKKSFDEKAYGAPKKDKKEQPSLNYAEMNKVQKKPSGPDIGQYWKAPDVKHSDMVKEKQLQDRKMEQHSKNPDTKLVTGKNKSTWAVNKSDMPSYKEIHAGLKARHSKLQKTMGTPMSIDEGAVGVGAMAIDPMMKDDMPHPAKSPKDGAHDVAEGEGSLKNELADQPTASKRKALLDHLRSLSSSGKLRSKKNQEIGKD